MAIQKYLQPRNAGKQGWQMLASDLTSGNHPYNVFGFCMALVAQWLLEIKFGDGATPDALGRYLLRGDLGTHGYGGIANSQQIYGGLNLDGTINLNQDRDKVMMARHSGGALERQEDVRVSNADEHWCKIRAGIYGVTGEQEKTIRLGDHARKYSADIGLRGDNSWLLRWLAGRNWGHAIGLHSDGNSVYFFDPNYGVFIFDQRNQGTMANFVQELWDQYGATGGSIAEVR